MTDYIFISYGRGDVYPKGTNNPVEREAHFTIVEKVYKDLQMIAESPWMDKFDLTADREFTDSINLAIENSRYVLLFIGPHAMNSEWCAREWKHALKHCVPIIPILLEGNWGDDDLQNAYPARILSTNGINPQNEDGTINDAYLKAQITQLIAKFPAPLTVPFNTRSLPTWYIERPQYTESIKRQLSVNDKDYSGSNIVGVTSKQEVASMQGVGGIGKSTLALAVVADCDVRRNFDMIFWIEVGLKADKSSIASLLSRIGSYFNDDYGHYIQTDTARTRVQFHLQDKRTLIVLDDVWTKGIIEGFSFTGIDCRILVTTRNKALVNSSELVSTLSPEEGLHLLATIFDTQNPDIGSLSQAHSKIIQHLDGYTLAIAIAGKWLKKYSKQSAESYYKRLTSNETNFFKYMQIAEDEKDDNLALSLSLTYNDLDDDYQRCFRQLGVLAPTSTVSEADLASLWQIDADEVFIPINAMVELGLLDETDQDGRYSQHTLLRIYARQAMNEDELVESFKHYVDIIAPIAEDGFNKPLEEWHELDLYLPHIDYIGDELVYYWNDESKLRESILSQVQSFVIAIRLYVHGRPQVKTVNETEYVRGLSWLEMGLKAFEKDEHRYYHSLILTSLGFLYDILGQQNDAIDAYLVALDELKQSGDKLLIAKVLNALGSIRRKHEEYEEAMSCYQMALSLDPITDIELIAAILSNIGAVHQASGDNDEALKFFLEEALPIAKDLPSKSAEGAILNNIGKTYFDLKQYTDAIEALDQSIAISTQTGDVSAKSTSLFLKGSSHLLLQELNEALLAFEEGKEILIQNGLNVNSAGTDISNYDDMIIFIDQMLK